jgi:hypothetical protein
MLRTHALTLLFQSALFHSQIGLMTGIAAGDGPQHRVMSGVMASDAPSDGAREAAHSLRSIRGHEQAQGKGGSKKETHDWPSSLDK